MKIRFKQFIVESDRYNYKRFHKTVIMVEAEIKKILDHSGFFYDDHVLKQQSSEVKVNKKISDSISVQLYSSKKNRISGIVSKEVFFSIFEEGHNRKQKRPDSQKFELTMSDPTILNKTRMVY